MGPPSLTETLFGAYLCCYDVTLQLRQCYHCKEEWTSRRKFG